ncbi:hypothetical protein D7V97_03900 [Corallococcus sp. CA053C]|uniref:hypothetical protein n=1 Tax=Corallococcus sp. CA053C TaxID=2316732 RepID=UPI000EA0475C|nr:hypothetical protein [Corallococcus sp. CA053C]RKH14116.1 hypothetical protein D7V97_03900 [Corallococcus sp. CA053C]
MSIRGERELRLERERMEALRLEHLRSEGRALVSVCERRIAGVQDAATQQYAAAGLGELVVALRDTEGRLREAPEAALEQLRGIQQRLTSVLTEAQARARSWSEAQVRTQARLEALSGSIEAVSAGQNPGHGLEKARGLMQDARRDAGRGAEAEALQHLDEAERTLDAARTASLDEKVRKEVVRGLLTTLKDMGFVVVGPRLSEDIVFLEGRLPSGRRARFEVKVNGQLSFDLDGYEGRTCAQEMEKVETAMRDHFGVMMGPPQVEWTNPDRLSQSALDLPGGHRSRGGR